MNRKHKKSAAKKGKRTRSTAAMCAQNASQCEIVDVTGTIDLIEVLTATRKRLAQVAIPITSPLQISDLRFNTVFPKRYARSTTD